MLVSGSSSSSIRTRWKSLPGRLTPGAAGEVVAGVAGGILPLALASSNSSINWRIVFVGLSTCCSVGSVGSGWSSSALLEGAPAAVVEQHLALFLFFSTSSSLWAHLACFLRATSSSMLANLSSLGWASCKPSYPSSSPSFWPFWQAICPPWCRQIAFIFGTRVGGGSGLARRGPFIFWQRLWWCCTFSFTWSGLFLGCTGLPLRGLCMCHPASASVSGDFWSIAHGDSVGVLACGYCKWLSKPSDSFGIYSLQSGLAPHQSGPLVGNRRWHLVNKQRGMHACVCHQMCQHFPLFLTKSVSPLF